MPGVRIDRLLASTAVVLLLAGAACRRLAGPSDDQRHEPPRPTPRLPRYAGRRR